MNDFDQVLDNSLRQIASGAATADECLAQHPEHSAQLKPLLQTADLIGRGHGLVPTDTYKSRARVQLMVYMQDHPRQSRLKFPPVWSIAISLAVLAIVFFVTGTAFAQGALPGQAFYDWKLSSEQIWRASSPDRVGIDLQLADRRTSELTSVSADSAGAAKALSGYEEVLIQLKSENNAKNNNRIRLTLKTNQQKLSAIGIRIPELDKQLSP